VPASIRTSLSRRKEVVRKCRPPIPPEQAEHSQSPSSPYLFSSNASPRPSRGRRLAGLSATFFRIHLVELAGGIHALQVEQAHFEPDPLLRAVMRSAWFQQLSSSCASLSTSDAERDRLVNGHPLVLAVTLMRSTSQHHVRDGVRVASADQDPTP